MSKIIVNTKEILKAVQTVGTCIKQKNTMPVLDNMLFWISDNQLTITADNLEIRTQVEVKVDYIGKIEIGVLYKLLTNILKGLLSAPMELSFNNFEINIKSGPGLYTIPLVKAEEFPMPKALKESHSIKVNSLEFIEALRRAILFTEQENSRNLHNIFIGISDGSTKIASTDGSVIYKYSLAATGQDQENDILISRDIAKYFIQTITLDEEIEINYTQTHLLVQLENRLVTAILSQGKFPQYDKLFASLSPNRFLKIDKAIIFPAIKRLYGIVDQNSHMLVFHLKDNKMELSFNNPMFKYNAKETLKCEYKGEDIKIEFKAGYLMNMMTTLDEEIRMELSGPDKPCLFFAENTRAILGPMSINGAW
jgi:DNA polymerase-3 subunit beta